ncbi:MAG: caspase family protein [Deltaproteobacteria bacterium]
MGKIFEGIFILFLLTLLAGCAGGLHSAATKGDTKAIKELLDGGADINESGMGLSVGGPPLLHAAYYGQVEAARLLLDRGADVNTRNRGGSTALLLAAWKGHASTAKLLIERGADVDDAMAKLEQMKNPAGFKLLERLAKKQQPSRQTESLAARPAQEAYPTIKSDIDELPAAMSEPRKNAYAVVIGIENYRSIPKSDYSRSDATLVKAYLKALGFQERNIEFLTDEKATRTDIEKSLEAWLPNRAKKDSTVLVYFSGHGAPEPAKGEAYLVPYDGDPNYLPVTGYPLKRLYASLGKLEAREIIVVLDSCFSGSGGRSVLAKGARPLVMMAPIGILSSNIAVLSATQGSQISTSSPQKGHGVFTYYFLKAIKDGKKNLAEIYEHITPQVEDEAKLLNVQQSPSISPDVEKIRNKFSLTK